jgi:hypothetical protein
MFNGPPPPLTVPLRKRRADYRVRTVYHIEFVSRMGRAPNETRHFYPRKMPSMGIALLQPSWLLLRAAAKYEG